MDEEHPKQTLAALPLLRRASEQEKIQKGDNRRMNSHYIRYQKLIISRAHSFSRSTGHDLDDLISQGNLIYCEALRTYDPARSQFSTFLHDQLTKGLHRYTLRQAKHRRPFLELADTFSSTAATQFRRHLFHHHLAQLSKEAQEVVRVVLSSPLELLGQGGPNRRRLRKRVTQRLRKQGLSLVAVKKTKASIFSLAYNKVQTEISIEDYRLPARKFRFAREEG